MTRGVLLDIDGVLTIGPQPLPGAAAALGRLDEAGVPWRLVTNASQRSRRSIADRLARAGIPMDEASIVSSASAAGEFLRSDRAPTRLLVRPEVLPEFEGVSGPGDAPRFVVLGDLGEELTAAHLNQALRDVLDGATLVALGLTRVWRSPEGPALDVGAYTAALEAATGAKARVFGKPDAAIFLDACARLGRSPREVVMIGDDVDVDVLGAQSAGLDAILVRTGKFRAADATRARRVAADVLEAVDVALK